MLIKNNFKKIYKKKRKKNITMSRNKSRQLQSSKEHYIEKGFSI